MADEDRRADYAAYFESRGLGGGREVQSWGVLILFPVLVVVCGLAAWVCHLQTACNAVLTSLAVCGYGALIGALAFTVYRALRVSSRLLLCGLVLFLVGAGLYADWVWFLYFHHHAIVLNPIEIGSEIQRQISERSVVVSYWGRWRQTVRTEVFSGGKLQAAYVLEALALFTVAACVARRCARRAFFCEACGVWVKNELTLPLLYPRLDAANTFVLLARGDVSPLRSASPVAGETCRTVYRVRVRFCMTCLKGMMWVALGDVENRGAARPRLRAVSALQCVPLAPRAVRELVDLARDLGCDVAKLEDER